MSRNGRLVAAGAIVVVAIGGISFFLIDRARAPALESGGSTSGQVKNGVPAEALAADPHAGDMVTRTEERSITVPMPETLMAAIAEPLAGHVGRMAAMDMALADAKAGRIDSIELERRLRETTQGHPELGSGLLHVLKDERAPAIALAEAHALAGLEDDATLRKETIAALRDGSPDSRTVGLLALMGRGDADSLALATDTLASNDPPDARATAAFLLNSAPDGGSGTVPDKALAAARAAVQDPQAGAHLREESTTLLGQTGAPENDVALLERTVMDAEPAVRMRALAALEATGADPARLRATFDRVVQDSSAPDRLVEMAKAWRAAHQ